MASSTFSDLPSPLGERGPLNNTLIIIVNNDGTLTVDQETLHKLLAEQENTSTNAVRLIRLGVAPTDCRSPVSSDGEDASGSNHVNITVEGYYPPGHGYPLAADQPLEPVIADEMNRLGQVNAMLDILSADDSFSIHDSIKMDHCYTNRTPCSDPNYTPPRAKAPEGRSFFTPLKKAVVVRAPAPVASKVMLVHPLKRPVPRAGVKTAAPGSLLKPAERPAPPPVTAPAAPAAPAGITEEMLNEKMMQFQRSSDDYNDLSGDDNEDKSNSSAEQSVDVEDLAPSSAGGKTAPRPPKAAVYKGPNQRGGKRVESDEPFDPDANRMPKMHAHKFGKAGLKVYGKARSAEERREAVPPQLDDFKKNYPRRENRKPPAHLLESFAGPALFSVPDVPRRVPLDARGGKASDADLDVVGVTGANELPDAPEAAEAAESHLTSTLLGQLDAGARRSSAEKALRQSVDTVSSDSLGEMDMVTEDDPDKLWCICQRPHNNRFMICCDVCGEWFHGKCVGITKALGQTMEQHGNEWTCPNCKKMGDAPGSGRRQAKITSFMRKPKPAEEAAVEATTCVVCAKVARLGTVYCSDDCLHLHAHETAMMEVHLVQPTAPQPETPTPSQASAPINTGEPPAVSDKSLAKKAVPATCGVKTSRPGSLKTWLKPSPALAKPMLPPTATSSPMKPKQVVLIDAKPMPPSLPVPKVGKQAPTETHKDVAVERVPTLTVPKLLLSPIKEKAAAKHTGYRVSRVEAKVPEAPKKEETEPIRINVRKTLHEQLLARTLECDDLKGIADEKVKRIATHVEEELFAYFNKDAGSKYKSKYRSLIFNIKDPKNLTLFRKIVDKSISAHQLVRLSAEEFASQELTQWREQETKHQLEMIKKNEMDLLALSKTYVMKTHKGEQVIESEDGVKGDASKLIDMDIDSVKSAESKAKSKDKKEKAKSKSKKSKSHKSSRDKKKHHSKSSKHHKNSHESSSNSTQKKLDDYVRVVDRREDLNTSKDSDFDNGYTGKDPDDSKQNLVMDASSVQEIIFGKVSEDQEMEVDESCSPDESVTSPVHSSVGDKEAAATVWKGVAEMPDVAMFQTTIQAVSGDSEKHCQTLPDHINIVGRISHNTVWDHVSKMKKTDSHEILVVRLTAKNENEKIAYVTLYSYLNTRNRLGVVGRKGVIAPVSQTIKDFYILPLSNHSPIPPALLPLQGPGLEEDRPHLLLGILVARSGRKRPAPILPFPAKARRLSDPVDVVARVFTPPPPDDDGDASSPPKPPSPNRDGTPDTPETHSTPEESSEAETEAETIRAKVASLLDEDAPYSPKDDDEDVPPAMLPEVKDSSQALQWKVDELNRKIAEQKLAIENISSGLGSDSLIPGLGISSFMGGKLPTSKDIEEAYSPSESITPPLKEAIPFISAGSHAPVDVIAPEISLPSNLHEILANIKKNTAVEPKMDLKHDPIVQSYSARMDEEKEKIAAKKEQYNASGAVYIPSSIKKIGDSGPSKVDELQGARDSSAGGKVTSVVAKPPSQPQMQGASGDPRKRPAEGSKPGAEPAKPKSTLSKLTDAELIEKAAAMELEMSVSSLVPAVAKKPMIKFSIPSQFGRAQGVGCLPDAPPPLPPPPPPPPPESPVAQSMRFIGLNSQASMPCNPPPPSMDYHIPFTNPPPPPPPLVNMNQPPPFPLRPPLPGRVPLPPLPGMHPLPPNPGMNPLPPVPGMNPLPPLPGRNPLPPLPGMNPPAPGSHPLYSHHPPPYRRGNYDRSH